MAKYDEIRDPHGAPQGSAARARAAAEELPTVGHWPVAAPHKLRFGDRASYEVPGLEGLWRIMGLRTTNMAEDGKCTLDLVRVDGVGVYNA